MKILANIPYDLRTKNIFAQEDIPCFTRINEQFIIDFDLDPYFIEGKVVDWDEYKLNLLFGAGVGGDYTYYNHSLITIQKIKEGEYDIISLKFFDDMTGWVSIIENAEYAEYINIEPGYE